MIQSRSPRRSPSTRRARRGRAPTAGRLPVDATRDARPGWSKSASTARSRALAGFRRAQSLVLGESRDGRRRQLGLLRETGRLGDRAAARSRLEQRGERCHREPERRSRPRRASARRTSGFTSERTRARSRSFAGIAGRRVSGAVRASTSSQPGSVGSSRSIVFATALWPGASSTTMTFRFVDGCEQRGVDADRDVLVVAREALGGSRDRLVGGAEQHVDAGEELRALVLARRHRDPLRREERRRRGRVRLEQRGRREARHARLEAVHDVERPERQRASRGSRGAPSGGRHARTARSAARRRSRRRPRSLPVAAPVDPRAGRRPATRARRP